MTRSTGLQNGGRLEVWFAESINALSEDIPAAIRSLIDAAVAEVL